MMTFSTFFALVVRLTFHHLPISSKPHLEGPFEYLMLFGPLLEHHTSATLLCAVAQHIRLVLIVQEKEQEQEQEQ